MEGGTGWPVRLRLYKKEILRFGIEVNGELSEELYEQIKKDVVLKRAKIAGDAFADRYGKDRITIEG